MNNKMKFTAIAIAAFFLVGGFIVYQNFGDLISSKDESGIIAIAEDKLLVPQTLLAVYTDVAKIDKLKTIIESLADEKSPKQKVSKEDNLLVILEKENINLLKQANKIFAVVELKKGFVEKNTLDASEKESPFLISIMITGVFDKNKIASAIEKHIDFKRISKNSLIYKVTQPTDLASRNKPESAEILIEDDMILITSQNHIKTALKRLTGASKQHKDLGFWRQYKSNKLMAVALFNPQDAVKSINNPFVKNAFANKKNQAQLDNFKKAFLGVDLSIINQSMNGNLMLWTDADYASKVDTTFNASLTKAKNKLSQDFASIKRIIETISTEVDDDMWNINIAINKSHSKDLKALPQQVMMLMFSGFKLDMPE